MTFQGQHFHTLECIKNPAGEGDAGPLDVWQTSWEGPPFNKKMELVAHLALVRHNAIIVPV